MQLCSCSSSSNSSSSSSSSQSSASNPSFNLFPASHGPTRFSRPSRRRAPLKYVGVRSPPSLLTLPPCSSKDVVPVLQEQESDEIDSRIENLEHLLVVRRPVKDPLERDKEEDDGEDDDRGETTPSIREDEDKDDKVTPFDASLQKFAEKLPIFEPPRGGEGDDVSAAVEKPLSVNLDLALYRAKVFTRNYQFEEAEKLLEECIVYWPEDGRLYVALGKVLRKQSRMAEAKTVYEKGCQATQGENAFIWQCWADLENRLGNVRRARELFDAATVANKKHIAAWHGWAVLELKQGNIKKARNLLAKGLKYCGGNEYVYQTLALLEVKAGRFEQARQLFKLATKCNPKSCASWLAWAQLEMQEENNLAARRLFERAVTASPKNRFAWHVWGMFEASIGNVDKARKLLKVGHLVNPKDPVLLQSLALLEYKHSTANLARVLFRRASEMDPAHQPVWFAWGWMEWKEGNIGTAREYYQKALSINSTTESAARCLQAWGVLEQRAGNLSAARRLFRSSLNVNSQSYVTWMTWASMEDDQGNSVRAEEIRDLYFQQRTEVVDDASWVMGFLDIFDPALDNLKKILNLDQNSPYNTLNSLKTSRAEVDETSEKPTISSLPYLAGIAGIGTGFDLDAFIKEKLSLDPSKIDDRLEASLTSIANTKGTKKPWRSRQRVQ
ncbi:hypothetical protein V2J09_011428 [Rumex salicifolius]